MAENTYLDNNNIQSTKMYNSQTHSHIISPQQNLIAQSHPITNSAGNPIMPYENEEHKSYSSLSHAEETKHSSFHLKSSQIRSGNFSVEGSVPVIAALNRLLPQGLKFHLPNSLPGTMHQNPPRSVSRGFSGQKTSKRKKVMNSTPIQSISQNSQNQDDYLHSNRSQHNIKRSNREKKPNPKHDLGYIQPRPNMGHNISHGNSRKQAHHKVPSKAYKECEKIFNAVKKHKMSPPFMYPVDPEYLQIPDYFEIIKQPMDLSTVEERLKGGEYTHSEQFNNDMNQIWNNSLTYNEASTEIYQMTVEIKAFYERLYNSYNLENSEMYLPQSPQFGNEVIQQQQQQQQEGIQETKKSNPKKRPSSKSKKKAANRPQSSGIPSSILLNPEQLDPSYLERQMTSAEKNYLGKNIKQLQPKYLHGIIEMMKDMNSSSNQQVLQFDIDQLPNDKLRQLQKYVNESLKMEGKTPHRVKQVKNSGGSKKKKPSQQQQQQQASNQQEGNSISKQIGDSNNTALYPDERAHNSAAQAAQQQIKKKQMHGQSSSSQDEQDKVEHNNNENLHEQQQKQAQLQQQQEQFLEQQRQQYFMQEQQQGRSHTEMPIGVPHQMQMTGHSQSEYLKKMMQGQAPAGQYLGGFQNPAQMMMYPPPPPPQYGGSAAPQQNSGSGYYQPDYQQQYQNYYGMQTMGQAPMKQQRPQDGKPTQ